MIFGIYEQADLFAIAKCGRRSTLLSWLKANRIAYAFNSKDEVIAHEKAIEAGLGISRAVAVRAAPQLCLE